MKFFSGLVLLTMVGYVQGATDTSYASELNQAIFSLNQVKAHEAARDSIQKATSLQLDSRNKLFLDINRTWFKAWSTRDFSSSIQSFDSLESFSSLRNDYPGLYLKLLYAKGVSLRMAKDMVGASSIFDSLITASTRFGSPRMASSAHYYKGRIMEDGGQYNDAILEYEESIKQSEKTRLKKNLGASTKSLGIVFRELGLYGKASEYYVKALGHYMEKDDLKGVATIYNSMAILAASNTQYPKALRYLNKALKYGESSNGGRSIRINVVNNQAVCYLGMEYFDSAKTILLGNMQLAREQKNSIEYGKAVNNLAIAHKGLGNYDLAIKYYHKSLRQKSISKQEKHIPYTKIGLGHAHLLAGNLDSASFYFERFSQAVTHKTSLKFKQEYFERMVDYYKATKQFEKALEAKDSLQATFQLINSRQRKDLQSNYESLFNLKASSLENEQLKNRIEEEENESAMAEELAQTRLYLLFVTIGILSIVLILVVIVWIKSSSLRKANEQLAVINDRLESSLSDNKEIISIVAHDLKSPLGQISGLLELMRDSENLDDEQRGYMKVIDKVLENSNRLIHNLMLAHQEEAVPLNITEFSLKNLIEETVVKFGGQASNKAIRLDIDMAHDISLSSDRDLVQRVVDNLLSNAIKFSPLEETVVIGLQNGEPGPKIRITDHGPGISESDKKLLFRRFQKLKNAPTGGESSSGLGLYITKSIADRLNAKIEIESTVGEGSTFVVSFLG